MSFIAVFVNGLVCKDPKMAIAEDFFLQGLDKPYGLNPPHTHPRASEILTIVGGSLYVGLVTSNPDNKLFAKVLQKGDVFVFPQGPIHFQFNPGHSTAVAFAGLGSQSPGTITIANAVFGSDPPIDATVLAKAFQLDKKIVKELQAKFWADMN